jgi:hypothetical protein
MTKSGTPRIKRLGRFGKCRALRLRTAHQPRPIGSRISINLLLPDSHFLFQPPVYHTVRVHFGILGRS